MIGTLKRLKRGHELREYFQEHPAARALAAEFSADLPYDVFLMNSFRLKELSYQEPHHFAEELRVVKEHFLRLRMRGVHDLAVPIIAVQKLTRIVGPGKPAADAARALAGIRVCNDEFGSSVMALQKRIRPTVSELRISYIEAAKTAEELLSVYAFGEALHANVKSGFGLDLKFVADLSSRHPNPRQFREDLISGLEQFGKKYFDPENYLDPEDFHNHLIVTMGIPTMACFAQGQVQAPFLDYLNKLGEKLRHPARPSNVMYEFFKPAVASSGSLEEVVQSLDKAVEATNKFIDEGIALYPPHFEWLGKLSSLLRSPGDFGAALTLAEDFYRNLNGAGENSRADQVIYQLIQSFQYQDFAHFDRVDRQFMENLLRYPFSPEAQSPIGTLPIIARMSKSPEDLVSNGRVYGRLTNVLGSVPPMALLEAIRSEGRGAEDECIAAINILRGKMESGTVDVKTKSGNYASPAGSFNTKLLAAFMRNNMMPKLIQAYRNGEFEVRMAAQANHSLKWDGYYNYDPVTEYAVTLEIIP